MSRYDLCMSRIMTKQQAAAEFVNFYRWSLYHNLPIGSEMTVLGWRSPLDVVRSEDEEKIMNAMERT